MEHPVAPLHGAPYQGFVTDIPFEYLHRITRADPSQIVARAERKIVQHHDLMPPAHQGFRQMGSDEPGTAGDQCFHEPPPNRLPKTGSRTEPSVQPEVGGDWAERFVVSPTDRTSLRRFRSPDRPVRAPGQHAVANQVAHPVGRVPRHGVPAERRVRARGLQHAVANQRGRSTALVFFGQRLGWLRRQPKPCLRVIPPIPDAGDARGSRCRIASTA